MRVFGVVGCKALVGLTVLVSISVSATSASAKNYAIFQPTYLSAHPTTAPVAAFNAPFLNDAGTSSLIAEPPARLSSFPLQGRSRPWAAKVVRAPYGRRLQCVPFARAASGIEIRGNAANWWEAAHGVYQRGSHPESGSVLNFRPTGRMHLGHVAVVTAVLDSRAIEIEHANWSGPSASRGGISHNISVIDVSAGNDWSAVRVSLGRSGTYGSIYPTYGFIYDRPDHGTVEANNHPARLVPASASYDEVAQAPERRSGTLDMLQTSISAGAPDRSIR